MTLSLNCNGASVYDKFKIKNDDFNEVFNDSKITEKRNATNQFATTTAVLIFN